jgi:Tfp pilus assembly protein PilN
MSMMINLLPDLRQAKLKERQRRQLATGVSIAIWVICGAVIGLMLVYAGGQKVIIASRNRNIADKETKLRAVDGLVDALSANQRLQSLPGLYDKRVYISKFFNAYAAATPTTVTIDALAIDSTNTLSVHGVAASYADVAKLSRSLAAYNVTVGPNANANNIPYFTGVTIKSVSMQAKAGIDFSINATLGSGATSGENN